MGDHLDTVVRRCESSNYPPSSEMVLGYDNGVAKKQVRFQLPLAVSLKKGDKISFYLGCVTNDTHISHDNYVSACVYRRRKELLSFDARDMRILTEIRAYQE